MSSRAAFFDVDGTLVKTNIGHYYLYFVNHVFSGAKKYFKLGSGFCHVPYWLILDRVNRINLNRAFYRIYRGLPSGAVHDLADACFRELIQTHLDSNMVEKIAQHHEQGDQVVLVSGSLDFILAPLVQHLKADACLCASMIETDGTLKGKLTCPPVVGEGKVHAILNYAKTHDVDLAKSYAYADDKSDLPLLSNVGHPVAVHPDSGLRHTAEQYGWEIID